MVPARDRPIIVCDINQLVPIHIDLRVMLDTAVGGD